MFAITAHCWRFLDMNQVYKKYVHAVSRDIFPSLLRLSVHALDFNLALIRRITLPLTKEQRDNFSN
jgi:hypothetical protein